MDTIVATVVLFSQLFHLNECINIRQGLFNPTIDRKDGSSLLDLSDHIRTTNFIQTSSSSKFKYKTQQIYQGIPIFGASLVFETDIDDDITTTKKRKPIFGKWHNKKDIENQIDSIQPQLSKNEALEITLNTMNITKKNLYGNIDIKLYIYHYKQKPFLSYIIKFSYIINSNDSSSSIYQPMIILNANTGDIFEIYDNKKNFITACGDGGNEKIGKVRYCGSNAFKINDNNNNPILANHYIQVYSNNNNDYSDNSQSFLITCSLNKTSGDYIIDDTETNYGYCPSCDLFEFANFVFNLYITYMGTIPIKDEHIPLKAYVHVGMSYHKLSNNND